jgi:hypothetical protein
MLEHDGMRTKKNAFKPAMLQTLKLLYEFFAGLLIRRKIIIPQQESIDGSFTYDGFEARETNSNNNNKGVGVFAMKALHPGTSLMILGRPFPTRSNKRYIPGAPSTSIWSKQISETEALDGNPHWKSDANGVGGHGLFLAMMINEATNLQEYNAAMMDYEVILTREVKAGEEILTYYGDPWNHRPYKVAYSVRFLATLTTFTTFLMRGAAVPRAATKFWLQNHVLKWEVKKGGQKGGITKGSVKVVREGQKIPLLEPTLVVETSPH